MCGAIWECVKCPGKVVCCCCKCACNMLMGFICSAVVLLVIIGLIVYFTVFYKKNSGSSDVIDGTTPDVKALIAAVTPATFRDFFPKHE